MLRQLVISGIAVFAASAVETRAHDGALDVLQATCATCHDASVSDASVRGPQLEGQKHMYLRKQLRAFRDASRKHEAMNAIARTLTDAQIDELSQRYASRPLRRAASSSHTLDPLSRPLVFCVRCHGSDGVSPNELWPSLAGLDLAYMQRQIAAFGGGERVDDMMRNWGGMVSVADMQLILEYFAAGGNVAANGANQ